MFLFVVAVVLFHKASHGISWKKKRGGGSELLSTVRALGHLIIILFFIFSSRQILLTFCYDLHTLNVIKYEYKKLFIKLFSILKVQRLIKKNKMKLI